MLLGLNPFNLIPLPYKIGIGVLLIAGIFIGGYATGYHQEHKALISFQQTIQHKTDTIQAAQPKIVDHVITQYVDRVHTIYVNRDVIKNEIPTLPPVFNNDLPTGWIRLYNNSIGGDARSSGDSDARPSGITPNQALGTITDNNSICEANKEQLIQLQNWLIQTQQSIKETNK